MEADAPPPRNAIGLRVGVSVALAAALVAGAVLGNRKLASMAKAPAVSRDVPAAPLVRGMRVQRQSPTRWIRAYGTVMAPHTWRVSAQVGGRIVDRAPHLETGDAIEGTGDTLPVLFRLDSLDAEDRLARAEADVQGVTAEATRLTTVADGLVRRQALALEELATAERERDRVERLVPRTLSPSDLDRERMQVKARATAVEVLISQLAENEKAHAALAHRLTAAERTVDLERRAVERSVVRAPSAGRVLTRHVERGDVVVAGQVLLELVNLEVVEVPLRVPASLHAEIRDGARVRLTVPSSAIELPDAAIARRSPLADEASRTFTVFVELQGTATHAPIAPGLAVEADIEGATVEHVFVVAREAFLEGRLYVAVPDVEIGGQPTYVVAPRAVEAEHRLDGPSLVRSGLEPGDLVVLTNLESLEKGSRVRLALDDTPAPADRP